MNVSRQYGGGWTFTFYVARRVAERLDAEILASIAENPLQLPPLCPNCGGRLVVEVTMGTVRFNHCGECQHQF